MTIQARALVKKDGEKYVLVGLNNHHDENDEFKRVMSLLLTERSINAINVENLDIITLVLPSNNELESHCIGNVSSEKTLAECYTDVAHCAGWVITDPDHLQIAKQVSEGSRSWMLSQAMSPDSKTFNLFCFVGETIDTALINDVEIKELLSGFGYDQSADELIEEMGKSDFDMIIAEMEFENNLF